MKPTSRVLLALCGLTGLLITPAHAQENPPGDKGETIKPAERPAPDAKGPPPPGVPRGDERREGPGRGGPPPQGGRPQHGGRGVEMKLTPFIGVVTRELSPDLRAHVGVPEGFGLVVAEVMPDSPAQQGGVRPHDVLITFGDQRLANVEQLMALVRERKKGDPITLGIKRGGEEQKLTLTISEKNLPAASSFDAPRGMGFFGGGDNDRRFEFRFDGKPFEQMGNEWREQAERYRRMAEEYRERVEDWSKGPKDKPFPEMPRVPGMDRRGDDDHDGPGGGRPKGDRGPRHDDQDRGPKGRDHENHGTSAQSSAESRTETRDGDGTIRMNIQRNVNRRDDSGEYSLQYDDGKATFSVRPREGEPQKWPVNTPAERETIPENYRAKLREMEKISTDNLRIEPNPAPPPSKNSSAVKDSI
jgi:hypothetical protein